MLNAVGGNPYEHCTSFTRITVVNDNDMCPIVTTYQDLSALLSVNSSEGCIKHMWTMSVPYTMVDGGPMAVEQKYENRLT